MVTRREFVKGGAAALALPGLGGCLTGGAVGSAYAGWRPGELDIHFIHTGVGEQTFFIFPDGTTMLLDCGDTHHAKYMKDVPPMPDASRYGGEWVSRYIQRLIPQREIDYAMVSHWHGDHCGDLMFGGKKMPDGRTVCGAGGGGFLPVVLKKGVAVAELEARLFDVFGHSGVVVRKAELV